MEAGWCYDLLRWSFWAPLVSKYISGDPEEGYLKLKIPNSVERPCQLLVIQMRLTTVFYIPLSFPTILTGWIHYKFCWHWAGVMVKVFAGSCSATVQELSFSQKPTKTLYCKYSTELNEHNWCIWLRIQNTLAPISLWHSYLVLFTPLPPVSYDPNKYLNNLTNLLIWFWHATPFLLQTFSHHPYNDIQYSTYLYETALFYWVVISISF